MHDIYTYDKYHRLCFPTVKNQNPIHMDSEDWSNSGDGQSSQYAYHNDPKFLDGHVWANSIDQDQTAPPSWSTLFAIPLCLHLLVTLLYRKTTFLKF